MIDVVNNEVRSLRDFESTYVTSFVSNLEAAFSDARKHLYQDYLSDKDVFNRLKDVIASSDRLDEAVTSYSKAFGEESGFKDVVDRLIINDLFSTSYDGYTFDLKATDTSYLGYTHSVINDLVSYYVDNGLAQPYYLDWPSCVGSFTAFNDVTESNRNNSAYFNVNPSYDLGVMNITLGNSFTDIRGNTWQPAIVNYSTNDDYDVSREVMAVPVGSSGELDIDNSRVIVTGRRPHTRLRELNADVPLTLANDSLLKFALGSSRHSPITDSHIDFDNFKECLTSVYEQANNAANFDVIDTFDWDKLSEFAPSVPTNEPDQADATDVKSGLQETNDEPSTGTDKGHDITD